MVTDIDSILDKVDFYYDRFTKSKDKIKESFPINKAFSRMTRSDLYSPYIEALSQSNLGNECPEAFMSFLAVVKDQFLYNPKGYEPSRILLGCLERNGSVDLTNRELVEESYRKRLAYDIWTFYSGNMISAYEDCKLHYRIGMYSPQSKQFEENRYIVKV